MAAVVSAAVALFFGHLDDAGRAIGNWIRSDPTADEEWATRYLRQTVTAALWEREPVEMRAAHQFLADHRDQYDPSKPHDFSRTGRLSFVPDVTRSPGEASVAPVIVLGRVLTYNVLRPAQAVAGVPRREIVVQLAPLFSKGDSIVYCRVNAPANLNLVENELLLARGIVIAAGGVSVARGGFSQGAYLACSAIARPRGRRGDHALPPLPRRLAIATYGARTYLTSDSPLAYGVLLRDDARRASRWWFRHRRDADLRAADRYVGSTLGGCERLSKATLSCEAEGKYRREARTRDALPCNSGIRGGSKARRLHRAHKQEPDSIRVFAVLDAHRVPRRLTSPPGARRRPAVPIPRTAASRSVRLRYCRIEADATLIADRRSVPVLAQSDGEQTVGGDTRISSAAGVSRVATETLAATPKQ